VALLRAGLAGTFRFHDLRHTAASFLAMSGASLIEIAEILGHKTLAMVRRYSHFTQGHTQGVVERMAQQFIHGQPLQEGARHGEL
jgi:integrase